MKNKILGWAGGIGLILALPLGCIVAVDSGSMLSGLAGFIAAILIGFLVCREEIRKENGIGK